MQQAFVGKNEEPIDVDDLYDGVECITAIAGPARKKRKRERSPRTGSSPYRPIVLDSDDESIVVHDRGIGVMLLSSSASTTGNANSNMNASAARSTRVEEAPSDTSKEPQRWLVQEMATGTMTPQVNTRFLGLAAPIKSPSPKKTAPTSRPVADPSQQQYVPQAANLHANVKIEPARPNSLSFDDGSSDDSWDVSTDGVVATDSDRDENLDDSIGLDSVIKQTESKFRSAFRRQRPNKTREMAKVDTSTLLIQPDRQIGRTRSLRIWDAYKTKNHVRLTSLHVDSRPLRKNVGILSNATSRKSPNTFNCWLNSSPLRLSAPPFQKTSGSVNKIAQSREFIAVGSPTSGGNSDPDMSSGTPEVDPYNREGNLVVWKGLKNILLDGHSRSWPEEDSRVTKYYTVRDVAFDPMNSNRLVSSGCDCAVRVVDLQICGDTFSPRNVHTFEYSRAPYDIVYKPKSSLFAVSCFDGNIHVHKDNNKFALQVSDGHNSRPGTFIWGADSENGALENMLFVSTESDKDGVCRHTAFDVERQCGEYELDINDSGDAMALDPQGRILALITSSDSNSSHSLSLFDVARGEGQRCLGTRVHPLQPHAGFPTPSIRRDRSSLEVAHASFSPDGILLALARTDNATHVYDVRYLSEEPLLVLRHGMVDDGTREDVFGVTGLKWVDGYERGRLGLVTGGADGCVRLWDVTRVPTGTGTEHGEGRKEANHPSGNMVLAQVDHDVACFSVGDPAKGERRLVIGDCAGEVHIFN